MASVRIISTFEVVRQMGPLVVKSIADGEAVDDVIDGPSEFRFTYRAGSVHRFMTKKSAADFVATYAGKAELL